MVAGYQFPVAVILMQRSWFFKSHRDMKRIFFLLFCFVAVKTFAQKPLLNMEKVKKYMQQNKALNPLQLRTSAFDNNTARFSHTTPQGNVFILPQDNMPCLKPDSTAFAYDMPRMVNGQGLKKLPGLVNQMPNAYTGKPFVFENVKPLSAQGLQNN